MNKDEFYKNRLYFVLRVLDKAIEAGDNVIVGSMVREYKFLIGLLEK